MGPLKEQNTISTIKYDSIPVSRTLRPGCNLYKNTYFTRNNGILEFSINHCWLAENSTLYKLHCLNRWFIFMETCFGSKLIQNVATRVHRLNMHDKNAIFFGFVAISCKWRRWSKLNIQKKNTVVLLPSKG